MSQETESNDQAFIHLAGRGELADLVAVIEDDPDILERAGDRAFNHAFWRGTDEVVEYLVAAGRGFHYAEEGDSPAVDAARECAHKSKPPDRFRLVFEKGILKATEINEPLPRGHSFSNVSMLHATGLFGHPELTEILFEFGAGDVIEELMHIHRKPRYTALQLASERSHWIQQRYLTGSAFIAHGAEYDIFSACGRHDDARLQDLLAADSDLATKPHVDGSSPIHWAASCGAVVCLKLLLDNGADPNVLGRDKKTPLHFAATHLTEEIEAPLLTYDSCGAVRSLLEAGAEIDVQDAKGRTPLHLSTYNGNARSAELLIERGANTTLQNKKGKTPPEVARMDAKYLKSRDV